MPATPLLLRRIFLSLGLLLSASLSFAQTPQLRSTLVRQDGVSDEIVIAFLSGGQNGYDPYDAVKLFSNVIDLVSYPIAEDIPLGINVLAPLSSTQSVKLGLFSGSNGTYTLNFRVLDMPNVRVTLHDALRSTSQDITFGGSLTVDLINDATRHNRFTISFEPGVNVPVPNQLPVATNVTITGEAKTGSTLTGTYSYSDAEADPEGASTFRWFRNGSPIAGATSKSYKVELADVGTNIQFGVTPLASSGNTTAGAEVLSPVVVPVANTNVVQFGDVSISQNNKKGNVITFVVLSEIGQVNYTLERSSGSDGVFKSVGNNPSSSDPTPKTYTATENNPPKGLNIYRVKATNKNGVVAVSSIVSIVN